MQNLLNEIQESLAKTLDKEFSPIPVFFEEISTAALGAEQQMPDDYIFVDLCIEEMNTIDRYRTDVCLLVSISMRQKSKSNKEYRNLGLELDGIFRPVFYFSNRAITVQNAGFKVVENVLIYTFTIRFIPSQKIPIDETQQIMGDIVTMEIN